MSDDLVVYRLQQAKGSAQHLLTRRWAVIVLMLVPYCLAIGVSSMSLLTGTHQWELDVQQDQRTWKVLWFDISSPASNYNIQPGDIIVQVDGHAPHSATEINQANSVVYFDQGREQIMAWPVADRLDWVLAVSWLVLGALSFLVSILVYLHATDRPLALRFFILWSTYGLVAALEPAAALGYLLASLAVSLLGSLLLFPMLVSFLWRFLIPVKSARHRWAPELPLFSGAIVSALRLISDQVRQPSFSTVSAGVAICQDSLFLCIACYCLIRAWRSPGSVQAERARTILGGGLIAFLPFLILTLIPNLLTGGHDDISGKMTGLLFFILLLAFAYAIIRRDLLHLDALARQSARIILAVVFSIIMAGLCTQVVALLPPPSGSLFALLAGAVLLPIIWKAARWGTDFWLFPQLRHYRHVLQKPSEITNQEPTPADLARQLTSEICDKMPLSPHHVVVFLVDQRGERFSGLAAEHPSIKVDDQLYLTLKRSRAPVVVEPQNASHATPLWHLLVPFLHRRLVGVLALCQREDGQEYSETDMQFLRALVASRAMVFEYAILFEELHTALQQQRRLEQITSTFIRGTRSLLADPLLPIKQQLALLHSQMPQNGNDRSGIVPQTFQRLGRDVTAVDTSFQRWRNEVVQVASAPILSHQNGGDLQGLVGDLITQFDERLRHQHATIHNLVQTGLNAQGDTATITRVIWQLLTNALDASGADPTISVQGAMDHISLGTLEALRQELQLPTQNLHQKPSVGREQKPAPDQLVAVAKLTIADRGEPIMARDLPFVFDRYSPDHEPPLRPGLPGCFELVLELHGGIWVESDSLTGQTAFHLVLPLATFEQPGVSEYAE